MTSRLGTPRLGIVAGGGTLPLHLLEACRRSGRPFFVLALKGCADVPFPSGVPVAWVRLGAVGRFFSILRAEGVSEVILAGSVRRPSLLSLRPDWKGVGVLARIGRRVWGDDGLLRALIGEIEAEGFRVVGVRDVFGDLLTPTGVLTSAHPDERAWGDIRRGVEVALGLGRFDVGQAVVVQQGMVLGVEAAEGTDALLERCGELRREGPGGVLVKMGKPEQDVRVDLPTIGPSTLARAKAAGLRGVAVESGKSIVLDLATAIAAADRLDLFVVGVNEQTWRKETFPDDGRKG